jgi:hypothetical protein
MEKLRNNGNRKLAALGVATISLAGCAYPNYSGEGNEFTITARVSDGREQSLKVLPGRIIEAHGAAEDWFHIGEEHQIHDNCDCDDDGSNRKTYGVVLDKNGNAMEPDDVLDDTCVLIEGKIRDDKEGKTHNERPVFDKVQIIECGEV